MKRFILFPILLIAVIFSLTACEYDLSEKARGLFTAPLNYRARLQTDRAEHGILLFLREDGMLVVRFEEGDLRGLELLTDGQNELRRLDGLEFPLPAPSDFSALPLAFERLSKETYLYRENEEESPERRFTFVREDTEYTVVTDANATSLISLSIRSPQKTLQLFITREDTNEPFPDPSQTQNMGGDPSFPPTT